MMIGPLFASLAIQRANIRTPEDTGLPIGRAAHVYQHSWLLH